MAGARRKVCATVSGVTDAGSAGPTPAAPAALSLPVSLGLAKATNARDLGGYRTTDGRQVRRGRLFRSNTLHRLSDADVAVLGELGLNCVIDFRHPQEKDLVGPDRLPTPAPGRLVALPLFDAGHEVFTALSAAFSKAGGSDQPELMARLNDNHPGGGSAAAMLGLYRWFVTSPLAREAFGAALRLVASPDALPLLYHCTAGKDRTGWLSALTLTALGVDRPTIVADYLHTNDLNAAGNAYVLSVLADRVDDTSVLVPMLEARREYLETAFAQADESYGGMDGYLRDGLGLSDEVRYTLRTALLG